MRLWPAFFAFENKLEISNPAVSLKPIGQKFLLCSFVQNDSVLPGSNEGTIFSVNFARGNRVPRVPKIFQREAQEAKEPDCACKENQVNNLTRFTVFSLLVGR